MASVREKIKDNKIISFQFTCSIGRDENGKQIRRYSTWTPPAELSPARARKAAVKAAEEWEKQAIAEYEQDLKDPERVKAREIARSRTDFVDFVLHDWFPICIDNGEHKPKTIAFYNDTTKNIPVEPVRENVIIETKARDLLAGMIEQKPKAKSYGFYLDDEVVAALEKLAKQNKSNKSKVLNTLLRNLLINK